MHRFLNRQWRGYALDLVLNQATNAVDNCWLAVFNHAHGDAITRRGDPALPPSPNRNRTPHPVPLWPCARVPLWPTHP